MSAEPLPTSDVIGLTKVAPFSRRGFMTASAAVTAGYTLAAGPVRADVIKTDTSGLATGDAKFRKRSEQRVRDLRKEAGTVFLVSHSEQSIRDTCERTIWLESGVIRADGTTDDVLKEYETYVNK